MIRLHVAKHLLSGKVLADVCEFFGTYCNCQLQLSSGSKYNRTYKAKSNCPYRKGSS